MRKTLPPPRVMQRFGMLRVVFPLGWIKGQKPARRHCLVICDCGSPMKAVRIDSLYREHITGCGCQMRPSKHGLHKHPIYVIWRGIKDRCLNPNAPAYKDYGGRGITICDRWRNNPQAFMDDMGPRPTPKHSVGRKDNDGPYAPWNCRWETDEQQKNNTRSNRFVTYEGKRMTVAQAAKASGIPHARLRGRLRLGWDESRLFSERAGWVNYNGEWMSIADAAAACGLNYWCLKYRIRREGRNSPDLFRPAARSYVPKKG